MRQANDPDSGRSSGRVSTPGDAGPAGAQQASEFLDEGHRARLEGLILQQQDEIAALHATIDRVRGLRDLAEWAAKMAGDDKQASVLVSDLTRALGDAVEGRSPARSFQG